MKIEDCKTLPEFFGVELGSPLWVEGKYFRVFEAFLISDDYDSSVDGRVLVGCLTGQLKWSTEPPKPEMTEDEKKILRELAAWFPWWDAVHYLEDYRGDEDEESPFGSCDFCGYEFNSELINEYEITHCPKCGEEIEESIDLGW